MFKEIRHNLFGDPAKISLFTATMIFLFIFTFAAIGIHIPAYTMSVNGEQEFIVNNPTQVQAVLAEIIKQEEEACGKKIEVPSDIKFERVFTSRKDIIAEEDIESALLEKLQFTTEAISLMVDGKVIAYLKDEKEAQEVLDTLKNEFTNLEDGEKLIALKFEEKVEINEAHVAVNELLAVEKVLELIMTGSDDPVKYTVKDGDSLWLIARRNNMYVDQILQANKLKDESIKKGQELLLVKSKPYINIIAQVEGEKTEIIPYEVEIKTDNSVRNSVRVAEEGANGEKKIAYVAIKRNGLLEKKEITEEKIIKQAVNRVLVKGSSVQVASRGTTTYSTAVVGSGQLDWPVYGPISSYYGSRGGSHTGVDITGRTGTAIKAADNGVVTFSGWQGGYGLFVIIDHNNGIVSRYAHCNSVAVSVGQRVSRGQTIATLGSTGNSTGPHLHFEVLSQGSFGNPLSYLR